MLDVSGRISLVVDVALLLFRSVAYRLSVNFLLVPSTLMLFSNNKLECKIIVGVAQCVNQKAA